MINKLLLVAAPLLSVILSSSSVGYSMEAGNGHYIPGTLASFVDMLPDRGTATFAYLNAFTYYHGSVGLTQDLELGGRVVANGTGTVYGESSVFVYQPGWSLLGGGQFGALVIVPYLWANVEANATLSSGTHSTALQVKGTSDGFGDIQMFPLMLGWKHGDLKWQTFFSVYAPTGGFEKGALANVGKNYWTFEPGAAISFLSTKFGSEATLFTGFDFNTENGATHYQSGDEFHLDGTIAQHLPLLEGFVGAGVDGFFVQQFTGDGGSGAHLGSFEGMTTGVGPVLSYACHFGNLDLAAEAKWLPEVATANRLEGNFVWFKLALSWGPAPVNALQAQ